MVTEVTFEPSSEAEQTLCVDVPVINDAVLEDVETFHVAIGTEAPRVAVPLSTATVSVEDDDTVEVTMVTSMVGVLEDVESGELQVCLQRVGPTEKAVDVVVFAESGSATGTHIIILCTQNMVICRNLAYRSLVIIYVRISCAKLFMERNEIECICMHA